MKINVRQIHLPARPENKRTGQKHPGLPDFYKRKQVRKSRCRQHQKSG